MKEAAFSLAEAKFATGDFNQVVIQNVTKAQIKIRTKKDNVAGTYGFYTYRFLTKILMKWQADGLAWFLQSWWMNFFPSCSFFTIS